MSSFVIEKTIAFSGHRKLTLTDDLYDQLYKLIEEYILAGKDTFLLGMAKGFDLVCGMCVVRLQSIYPDVKIVPIVPCDNQTDNFTDTEKIFYKKIMTSAYEIIQTGKLKTAYSMRKRNRYLVDNSSILICFLKNDHSGTFYTCNYAHKKGVPVKNIADFIKSE